MATGHWDATISDGMITQGLGPKKNIMLKNRHVGQV